MHLNKSFFLVGFWLWLVLFLLSCVEAKNTDETIIKIGLMLRNDGTWKNSLKSQSRRELVIREYALRQINVRTLRYHFRLIPLPYDVSLRQEQIPENIDNFMKQRIKIVIGPEFSTDLKIALDYVAEKEKEGEIIFLSTDSTAISLAKRDYAFRLMPSDVYQSEALSYYISVIKQKSVVVPVCANDLFARDFVNDFSSRFPTFAVDGNNLVFDPIEYDLEDVDWVAVTSQIDSLVQTAINEAGSATKVAVLFKGFEEILELFEQISTDPNQYPFLNNVEWFGTDTTSQNLELESYPSVRSVSVRLNFTASSPSLDYTSDFIGPAQDTVFSITGDPISRVQDVLPYDAFLLATRMYTIVSHYATAKTLADLIPEIAESMSGIGGSLEFDSFGDRQKNSYDFYRIDPVTLLWNGVASYPKVGKSTQEKGASIVIN